MTITQYLATVVGMIKIDKNEGRRNIAGNFYHHANPIVQMHAKT